MKTEGPWELGDLLEGQNLVRDLIVSRIQYASFR
jgi:hypothetical protein